jgi:hypothetical protein
MSWQDELTQLRKELGVEIKWPGYRLVVSTDRVRIRAVSWVKDYKDVPEELQVRFKGPTALKDAIQALLKSQEKGA